MFNAVL